MEMIPVESSNVAAIGYDPVTATLRVQFIKGRTYEYYSVPEHLYQGLIDAGSKGQFLDIYIKKAGYSYSPV